MIIANGPEDHEAAMDMVRLLRDIPPDPNFVRTHVVPPPVTGPMLERRVELFLEQFNQKQRAEANKLDTAFTRRLLVGIVGDKALADVGEEEMDLWLDALPHWPLKTRRALPSGPCFAAFAGDFRSACAFSGVLEQLIDALFAIDFDFDSISHVAAAVGGQSLLHPRAYHRWRGSIHRRMLTKGKEDHAGAQRDNEGRMAGRAAATGPATTWP